MTKDDFVYWHQRTMDQLVGTTSRLFDMYHKLYNGQTVTVAMAEEIRLDIRRTMDQFCLEDWSTSSAIIDRWDNFPDKQKEIISSRVFTKLSRRERECW